MVGRGVGVHSSPVHTLILSGVSNPNMLGLGSCPACKGTAHCMKLLMIGANADKQSLSLAS